MRGIKIKRTPCSESKWLQKTILFAHLDSAGIQSSIEDKAYVFSHKHVLYFLQRDEGKFEVSEMYNSEHYPSSCPLFKP
jgi:hypothetical protein